MMLRLFALFAAVVFAALHGSAAVEAAVVSNQGGTVLVSKGDGLVPLTANAEVAPGGRVVVQPGGLATITYASNCTVRVGSGFWMVQQAAPCAEGTTEIDFTGRMNQQGPPAPQPGDPDQFVAGAIVIGGAIAVSCAVWWCRDNPASP
jgi:hypothetical protein